MAPWEPRWRTMSRLSHQRRWTCGTWRPSGGKRQRARGSPVGKSMAEISVVFGGERRGAGTEAGFRSGSPKWSPEELDIRPLTSGWTADAVLRRLRRYNSKVFEELQPGNLERECIEEACTMEEAREVFEDDDKTTAFWARYKDGDQCQPPPCQNGGECEDGINTYTCYCNPNFNGKNCEIELKKQCSLNNGGCSHFCLMSADVPVCRCAAGYTLGLDKRSCEPSEQFSCGRVDITSLAPRSSRNITEHSSEGKHNSSYNLEDDYDIMQFYDDYSIHANDSGPSNVSAASAAKTRSVRSDRSSSVSPDEAVMSSGEARSATEVEKKQPPSWAFFPTLPTITAQDNTDQRIVGGNDAIPGEIPWQVALMSRSDTLQREGVFCGGSLISELWVITAAHCLVPTNPNLEDFFVRVGEHDVSQAEGSEQDHEVAEKHMHHLYDTAKSAYDNDIALLKLAKPVVLSNRRRPICLGLKDFTENLSRESSTSLVSGWGNLRTTGSQPNKLQKLEVPYVDRTVCKQSSEKPITSGMFCAGFENEVKDSCKGDSGGPHATNYKGTWFLTGIVSWGEECAKAGKYGVYTRVARFIAWIRRTTGLRIIN
uniref:Coagulation factor IX n=1 Tax=Gasterosteus aculeatus aculeatus TaxID=481459 RepID=G3QAX6_GASAC|nr:coagulation factor IXb isoform X2 [Gasterosteus aculeatus aculeatus]